jgi:hypothetical protein
MTICRYPACLLLLCLLPSTSALGTEAVPDQTPPTLSTQSGEQQAIDLDIPIPPQEADEVRQMGSSGGPVRKSREPQIIQDYDTGKAGVIIPPKKGGKIGIKLQLVDHPDGDLSRNPHW